MATNTPALDIKQVWFPGVHADVGGGYPEPESGLSKISFQWMLGEAADKGLVVNNSRADLVLGRGARPDFVAPNPNAVIHKSSTLGWLPAEFVLRRRYDAFRHRPVLYLPLSRRRFIPPGALIHEAAYSRSDNYRASLPPDGIPVSSLALPARNSDVIENSLEIEHNSSSG